MSTLPKILVATPTYDGKNYCLPQFIANTKAFQYPSKYWKHVVFDNSASPANARYISTELKTDCKWRDYGDMGVLEKLAATHNDIREYFLSEDFDYLLHLESDLFPEETIIQELLWTRKKIVSPMYMIGGGAQRHVIVRDIAFGGIHGDQFQSIREWGHFTAPFIDGTVRRCMSAGLGCALIHRSVLQKLEFRYVPGESKAPDSYFTHDLFKMGIHNYVHTGLLVFHWNDTDWGRNADLIKYKKQE